MPDWTQRLRDQIAEAERRRQARAELRQQLAAARGAGLARRHARKLDRRRNQEASTMPTDEQEPDGQRPEAPSDQAAPDAMPDDGHDPEVVNHRAAALDRLRRHAQGGYRPRSGGH